MSVDGKVGVAGGAVVVPLITTVGGNETGSFSRFSIVVFVLEVSIPPVKISPSLLTKPTESTVEVEVKVTVVPDVVVTLFIVP